MLGLVLACTLAADPPAGSPSPKDRAAYQSARAAAGRDADAHVRLALWCEAHGMSEERAKHLALAVVADPGHALARSLLGLMPSGSRWKRPDDVAGQATADAKGAALRAEYEARRQKAASTADAQWRLALWCEENGLKPEAEAHLTAVVRLDPSRDAAWKRLGCKKVNGRWVSTEQAAADKAEAEAQKRADKVWKAKLRAIRDDLKDPAKAASAGAELARVTDPRAVPSALAVFGGDLPRLIQVLGQIDNPAASRWLAVIAISAPSADDRRAAGETLRGRDPREFAAPLIDLFRAPIKYEVRPVGGPGSPGVLLVEGKRFDIRRIYAPPPMPAWQVGPGETLGVDAYGLPAVHRTMITTSLGAVFPDAASARLQATLGLMGSGGAAPSYLAAFQTALGVNPASPTRGPGRNLPQLYLRGIITAELPVGQMEAQARVAALSADAQLQRDARAIDAYNQEVSDSNEKVREVLSQCTGLALPADRDAWKAWYIDQLGYRFVSPTQTTRPTIDVPVPLEFEPEPLPVTYAFTGFFLSTRPMSCFGKGTPVRTLTGPRPIESLCVGDRVLAQDPATGLLSFEPILAIHHNPPSTTLKIALGGETIVSSTFHRFWVAHTGWKMARDLKPGDPIRTLGGIARVESVSEGAVQPVYNLDIARARTFFVGTEAALVHDNSVPDFREKPFDAAPDLLTAKGEAPQSSPSSRDRR